MMQKKQELTTYEKIKLFENNDRNIDLIRIYNRYYSQTPEQITQAYREWNEYYEKCTTSPAGENFFSMRDAFKHKDMVEVRERSQWARELSLQGNYISKPKSIDPYWVLQNELLRKYATLKREYAKEQEILKAQGSEQDKIFT